MNKTNHPSAFIPYPSYKDSGVPWLGEVPKHWEMRKTKYSFNERVQKGFPNEQLLAATQTKGVVPKTHYENRTVIAQKDLHLLKLVKKGDFVISLRSFQGGIELAHYQGIISPAYTIMNPKKEISGGYFKHLAKSKLFIKLLTTCVTGIREGQNIDYEILKRTRLPIPTNEEQTAIARFLDYKTAQIARFIKAKKRMIELLKEQKQAIINDAVTGKIDVATGKPYPKYNASGVEWLGQVPEGWEVRRLKNVGEAIIGVTYSPSDLSDETGTLVLRSSNIKDGKMIKKKDVFVSKQIPIKLIVKSNDILICARNGSRKLVGKSALVTEEFVGSTFGVFMSIFRSQLNDFVYLILNSNIFNFLAANFSTSTINQLTLNDLNNLPVPLPPRVEQIEIVKYIQNESNVFALTISRTEREIALMQEYRTRLISDVVTGKIDVRDIKIPDSANIDDTLDESIDESEGEEELETAEGDE